LTPKNNSVRAFGLPDLHAAPYRVGDFVGSVVEGGPCNCDILTLAPHGHGTHTECVGHIAKEQFSINQALQQFMSFAALVSITPAIFSGDNIITKETLVKALPENIPQSIVLRTLPNQEEKREKNYSNTNPPFFAAEALEFLAQHNVNHLLTDLPSVDREEDGGKLAAHHAFWQYPQEPRMEATITELVFIPNDVPDGIYLLNMQIAPLESDASPSKPILYSVNFID
jgi:kynurenine formamidase